MTLAFKEWGYIVDALGKGKQSIIIRKGGIAEDNGDFHLKGKRFLLFPTQYHQAREMIKPEWLDKLDGDQYQLGDDKVRINHFAEVVDSRLIKDWSIMEKLDGQHVWKMEVIKERFNRWERSAHLLILQVYQLDKPFDLEVKAEYGGCKSWVDLDESIELSGKPVVYEMIKGKY